MYTGLHAFRKTTGTWHVEISMNELILFVVMFSIQWVLIVSSTVDW